MDQEFRGEQETTFTHVTPDTPFFLELWNEHLKQLVCTLSYLKVGWKRADLLALVCGV